MSVHASRLAWFGACALLVACEPSRPDGAYEAPPNGLARQPAIDLDASAEGFAEGGAIAPAIDAGFLTFEDGGLIGGGGDGGGPAIDDETLRLAKLSGLYFMRVDVFTPGSASVGITTVTTRARASYYLLTQLGIGTGASGHLALIGQERFCYLTVEGSCKSGSSTCTLSSSIANQSIQLAQIRPPVVREYPVNGLTVTAAKASLPLGYDLLANDPPSFDPDTLTLNSPRVWDPIAGNDDREGLYVVLNYQGPPFNTSVNCSAITVQRLDTQLDGQLVGTTANPSLEGTSLALRTDGSTAKDLKRSPAGVACDTKGNVELPDDATVVFARADLGAGALTQPCPAVAAWDELDPPVAP